MNFKQIHFPLDVSEVLKDGITFHRSYLKPQKYNRNFKESFTFAPGDTYIPNNSQAASKLALDFSKLLPDIEEIPQVFLLRFSPPETDNAMLPPHVDYGRTCAINIYVKSNEETTKFYNWDSNKKEVNEVSSFVALLGSSWILDVSVPHSVNVKKNKERLILSLSYCKTPYSEIVKACSTAGLDVLQ